LDILLRRSTVLEQLQHAVQGALSQNEIARGLARVSLSLAVIGRSDHGQRIVLRHGLARLN